MPKCLFVAVDYFSTATYYWPNIVENATQIEDTLGSGTDTYEPTPDNGPFGFGAALKLDGTEANINPISENIAKYRFKSSYLGARTPQTH